MRRIIATSGLLIATSFLAATAQATPLCLPGADRDYFIPHGDPWTWFEEGKGHTQFIPQQEEQGGTRGILVWDGVCAVF